MFDQIVECYQPDASGLLCAIVGIAPRVLLAALLVLLTLWLNRRIQHAIDRIVDRDGERRELARLLGRMARIGVWIVTGMVVLSVFRQTQIVTSFIASLGITGLLLAFALQDITKNFAAGVLLLLLRPFRLADRIKVRDFEGQVMDVSLRATTLRTAENVEVLVPNADVYTSPIINFTRYATRRHHLALTVPLSLEVEPVRRQIEAALRSLDLIEQQPVPEVVATGLSGDGVTLEARFWLPAAATDAAERISSVIQALRPVLQQAMAPPEAVESTAS